MVYIISDADSREQIFRQLSEISADNDPSLKDAKLGSISPGALRYGITMDRFTTLVNTTSVGSPVLIRFSYCRKRVQSTSTSTARSLSGSHVEIQEKPTKAKDKLIEEEVAEVGNVSNKAKTAWPLQRGIL